MRWTAILPLKPAAERKGRLAGVLSWERRAVLTDLLLNHVAATLKRSASVDDVILLSAIRPEAWELGWREDGGCGLNSELEAAREALGRPPFMVIHPDLPLLRPLDVDMLADAAARMRIAIAPDRHGTGTNAVAIAEGPFRFYFGAGSFAAHRKQGVADAGCVEIPGLAVDLDTPEDLEFAQSLSCEFYPSSR